MASTIISTHTLLPKLHPLSPSLKPTTTISPFSSRDLGMRLGAVKAAGVEAGAGVEKGAKTKRGVGSREDGVRIMNPWSIRDDLVSPSSQHVTAHQPPVMGYGSFQSVNSQLFQHRIIRCGGAISAGKANRIVAQLLYLDAVDPTRDIVMYVNCPGGSVTAGMAILDIMRHIRPDVSTVCVGLAASMGAIILGGGTKGKRYSLPSSRIMVQQRLAGGSGTISDLEIQTNEMMHHKATLNGHLAYFTGKPLEQIIKDTALDFFMSPQEAKNYGLIDGIIMNPLKALHPLAAASSDESRPVG
ncbi:hypothetical protein Droror1_Dr00024961 [Drosera rotundifolia]